MSDWQSAPICVISGSEIVNDRDDVLVVPPRLSLRIMLTSVFRRQVPPVTSPDGTPLFSYKTKVGSFKNWLKIYDPDHELLVRIDQIGNRFTALKRRYTIRDATGTQIGRIDNPRLRQEFVVLDVAGTLVARGVRRGEEGWEVSRPAVRDSPWPEIAAAFFLSGIGTVRQGSSI